MGNDDQQPEAPLSIDGVTAESSEGSSDEQAEHRNDKPVEDLKEGLGLLWRAATGTAQELKRQMDDAGLSEKIQQASRDIETVANQAAEQVGQMLAGVKPPPAHYGGPWPGQQQESAQQESAQQQAAHGESTEAASTEAASTEDSTKEPQSPKTSDGSHASTEARETSSPMRIEVEDE